MSHTSNYDHPDGRTTFHYDSDGSGLLTIVQWTPSGRDNEQVNVPFENVTAFVLDQLVREQGAFLENATTDERKRYFLGRVAS
jgi:hypothetical protein